MLNFVKQKHKLIIAVLVAVNVGCFAVLIPQVRAAIIYFGEQCIVHRALNVPIWHSHLTRMAHIGIAVFLPSLFVFFVLAVISRGNIPGKDKERCSLYPC